MWTRSSRCDQPTAHSISSKSLRLLMEIAAIPTTGLLGGITCVLGAINPSFYSVLGSVSRVLIQSILILSRYFSCSFSYVSLTVSLQRLYEFLQSVGVTGGRPGSSYYFVGDNLSISIRTMQTSHLEVSAIYCSRSSRRTD